MVRIVGIGEYVVSGYQNDILKTFALASCVGITIYDPVNKVLAMAHIVLPDSKILGVKPVDNPAYYVNTAVPLLFSKLCPDYKQRKDELEIKIYGGANSIRETDSFKVGLRNLEMLKSKLKEKGMRVSYSDIGGTVSRSLTAYVASGLVRVNYQPLKI